VKHEVTELTMDLALRILRSSFAHPTLGEAEAVNIIGYHLERNRVAYDSHRKSWLAKHKRLAKKLLLWNGAFPGRDAEIRSLEVILNGRST
jgi:hypothetical protein